MKGSELRKYIIGLIGVYGLFGVVTIWADPLDGADILKREERRAQELKDIEYQTQLLERKARLAKAYQELQAHGGFVPDLEFMRTQEQRDPHEVEHRQRYNASPQEALPILRRIEGRRAHFDTPNGTVVTSQGGNLPGGFRVVSISMENGVELERSGVRYRTDVSWN